MPVRSRSPLPPGLKFLSFSHLCLCLPSCQFFFYIRTKCVFPHPKLRCGWKCSCCAGQKNVKFIVPLIAFTTVRCTEVGSLWGIIGPCGAEADIERPFSPICVNSLTPVNLFQLRGCSLPKIRSTCLSTGCCIRELKKNKMIVTVNYFSDWIMRWGWLVFLRHYTVEVTHYLPFTMFLFGALKHDKR